MYRFAIDMGEEKSYSLGNTPGCGSESSLKIEQLATGN
jgi:hypothetical protein